MSDDEAGRIDQLEEALAHHQAMVQDLSDELSKQWQAIERLIRRIGELEEKIASLGSEADTPESDEPPPPHY